MYFIKNSNYLFFFFTVSLFFADVQAGREFHSCSGFDRHYQSGRTGVVGKKEAAYERSRQADFLEKRETKRADVVKTLTYDAEKGEDLEVNTKSRAITREVVKFAKRMKNEFERAEAIRVRRCLRSGKAVTIGRNDFVRLGILLAIALNPVLASAAQTESGATYSGPYTFGDIEIIKGDLFSQFVGAHANVTLPLKGLCQKLFAQRDICSGLDETSTIHCFPDWFGRSDLVFSDDPNTGYSCYVSPRAGSKIYIGGSARRSRVYYDRIEDSEKESCDRAKDSFKSLKRDSSTQIADKLREIERMVHRELGRNVSKAWINLREFSKGVLGLPVSLSQNLTNCINSTAGLIVNMVDDISSKLGIKKGSVNVYLDAGGTRLRGTPAMASIEEVFRGETERIVAVRPYDSVKDDEEIKGIIGHEMTHTVQPEDSQSAISRAFPDEIRAGRFKREINADETSTLVNEGSTVLADHLDSQKEYDMGDFEHPSAGRRSCLVYQYLDSLKEVVKRAIKVLSEAGDEVAKEML